MKKIITVLTLLVTKRTTELSGVSIFFFFLILEKNLKANLILVLILVLESKSLIIFEGGEREGGEFYC